MATAKKAPAKKASPAKKSAPAKKRSAAPKKMANDDESDDTSSENGMNNMGKDGMLHKFFEDEIKDIYWAEKHLVKTLPKMKKAATSEGLKQCFEDHLAATQEHVSRLEQVFELLGKKAQAKKCDAMAGITEEGQGIIEETEKGTATRDVGLILSAQKVEHYEIATYGGLAQLATTLGLNDIADILRKTLEEEKEADQLLSYIAEHNVNYEASAEQE